MLNFCRLDLQRLQWGQRLFFRENPLRAIGLFVKFLLVIGVAMLGAVFAMENSQLLKVSFVLIDGPNLSAGVWMIIFLAMGSFLGMLSSSALMISYRRKLSRATKEG